MKSALSPCCYNHFLTLSIAIRILADPELCITFNAYAESLLLWFVSNYGEIYGYEYLSFNVHNLLHIIKDVQIFGCLDNFSCFKYENCMQKIKRKLHQSGKSLQELSQPFVRGITTFYPFLSHHAVSDRYYCFYKF